MYYLNNLFRVNNILPKLIIITFPIFLFQINAYGQVKGSISGKIKDKSNNEELIGANVLVIGTNTGASTDIDGFYSINNLNPGKYNLRFSFISYQNLVVEDVIVESGKEIKINVDLQPTSTELNEVVVTADALKSTEGAILNIQRNSLNIVDGISAELISKNNSSDGTDILKRMTGVTIADGKYAFVRGVGDRYNNTMLNGSNLPSTDPEKRSFSYDLFPASLIENVLTSKTFIPDKPADFTGGLVEINTIEFPSKFIFDISTSTSYHSLTTFKDFVGYGGGKNDFLGWDDGTRKMPSLITSKSINKSSYSSQQLQEIGTSFSNNWATNKSKAPVNSSFKFNLGNKLNLGNQSILGYIGSLTYSSSNEIKELEQASHTFEGPRYEYKGTNNSYSVNWGALLNLSLKLGLNHKFSFKNVYNQSADDETIVYEGFYRYSGQIRNVTSLRFISRSLQSSQLIGEHHFAMMNGLKMDWNVNYSKSKRDEPDARRFIYAKNHDEFDDYDEPFRLLLDQSLTTRFFGSLDDNNYGANMNFSLKPFENTKLPRFKFGYTFDSKDRVFDARIFGFRNIPGGNFLDEDRILQSSIENIFQPENINSTFIEIVEITQPTDSYTSEQTIHAGYLMMDFEPVNNLKFITGLRYEYSNQKMNSFTRTGEPVNIESDYNDVFPSLNITYQLSESINLRAAYSRTIARPEFRELAPFTYFDFVSNELVQGNLILRRSLITNYDLRFEYYPAPKELFAVSVFYKKFLNPIEQVLLSSSAFEPIRSYENAKDAQNYGLEFELRKSLSFAGSILNNFSFVGNLAIINSKIEMEDRGFQEATRPLQGQADFILNAGLYYETYNGDLSASLIYNKVGDRIAKVGFAGLGDVIEKSRDQWDFSLSTKVISGFSFKVAVKDIFAQDIRLIQKTESGDKPAETIKKGQNLSVGFSYGL